jgi:YVTN family beta-propeller protein
VAGSPFATGNGPYHGCCLDAIDQMWIVNNIAAASTMTCYSTRTKGLVGTYAIGRNGVSCAVDNLSQVWATNNWDNNVTVYNTVTKANLGNVACGNNTWGVAVDALGQVWVANNSSNSVTVINAATRVAIGTYATGKAGPTGVVADGVGQVWVIHNSGFVVCFNAATYGIVGTYATGANSLGGCVTRAGHIWICNNGTNTVTIYDVTTKALVTTLTVGPAGSNPMSVAEDAFGNVWVTCQANGVVRVYDEATRALVATYATGVNPCGICHDQYGQTWINNNNGGGAGTATVCRADPVFLAYGAEFAQGALWVDYRGVRTIAPIAMGAAQLGVRLWDDAAALVTDLAAGALTTAEAVRTVEWNAATGCVNVLNGAVVLATKNPPLVWVPEAANVTPLYVGSDPAGSNAARCLVTLVEGFNF